MVREMAAYLVVWMVAKRAVMWVVMMVSAKESARGTLWAAVRGEMTVA